MTHIALIGGVYAMFVAANFLAVDLSPLLARMLDCPGPGCPADPESAYVDHRERLEQELRSLRAQKSKIEDELKTVAQRIKSVEEESEDPNKGDSVTEKLDELLQRRDVLRQQERQVLGEIWEVQQEINKLPVGPI